MKKSSRKTLKRLFLGCVASSLLMSSVPAQAEYCQGMVAISPLTLNIASLTKRFRHKDAKINGFSVDPYKGTFGTGLNRGDRIGIGYDLELGIFAVDNFEVFTTLSYVYERGNTLHGVGTGVFTQFFGQPVGQTISYAFKSRNDAALSLGGRYFWNIEKSNWMPFISLRGTIISQGATKADLAYTTLFFPTETPIGRFVLQKRKTLWGGMIQGGADYRINDCIALTFAMGLQYTTRANLHYVQIPGTIPQSYQDNYNKWTVPIQFSVRFTF